MIINYDYNINLNNELSNYVCNYFHKLNKLLKQNKLFKQNIVYITIWSVIYYKYLKYFK